MHGQQLLGPRSTGSSPAGSGPHTHHGPRNRTGDRRRGAREKAAVGAAAETYDEEQERRAEARRLEEEQREQEYEAEQARREELRQTRRITFERILENAPKTLNAAQLRVLLRAIVNLDPYTFADDLVEDIAVENERRSPEEVLLATIATTADEKLTHFAVRLALSGHVSIPRENEPDFLNEADAVFALPKKETKAKKTGKAPVALSKTKTNDKKQTAAKKQIAA